MSQLTTTLPKELIEGLEAPQINIMTSTVTSVNESFKVAGLALRATAEELWRLKQVVPNGTWIKFLKSGVLPIGERTARDLVKAYSWLAQSDLSDAELVNLSARSMAKIAAATPKEQKTVEKRLKEGEKLDLTRVESVSKNKVGETIQGLKQRIKVLEAENLQLKARIAELELQAA